MKLAKQHVSNLVSSKLIWTWAVAAVLLQLCCVAAYGQDKNAKKYKTLPFAKEFKMIKTDRSMSADELASIKKDNRKINSLIKSTKSKLSKALRSGTDGSMQADMDKYINGYMFPLLTQDDEVSLSRLGAGREFFLKNFVIGKAQASRARVINGYILPQCKNILKENFHPAVRMNAIVMLGLLNDAEGRSGQAPILTSSTFPLMKSVLTGDFPDYLKVGALAGIQRHIEVSRNGNSLQVSPSDETEMSKYCLAVLKGSQKGQDKWSPDIDYWMKRRSAQVLGSIGNPSREVLDVVLGVLKTEPAKGERDNFWVRGDALVALASFDSKKIDSGRVAEVMDGVTGFTAVALKKEAEYLETTVDDLVRSNILFADKDLVKDPTNSGRGNGKERGKGSGRSAGGSGAGTGGFGGGADGSGAGQKKEEEEKPTVELPNFQLNASRQRIKIVLNTARNAFTRNRAEDGLLKIASGDNASQIDSIVEVIDDLMEKSEYGLVDRGDDEAEAPKNVTLRLAEDYRKGSNQMKDLMLTKMEDAPAPAASAEGSDTKN